MYIYRYMNPYAIDPQKPYYIGQTNDLQRRDREHSRDDDWCYEFLDLEYITCENFMADNLEAYYIEKLKPLYNTEKPSYNLTVELLSFVSKEHNWRKFER